MQLLTSGKTGFDLTAAAWARNCPIAHALGRLPRERLTTTLKLPRRRWSRHDKGKRPCK